MKNSWTDHAILNFWLQLAYSMKLDYDMQGYRTGVIALLQPKVNVSSKGFVPTSQQVFAIRLPCSGLDSAEIKLSLKLNISAPPDSHFDDINLVFKRNKICMRGKKIIHFKNTYS